MDENATLRYSARVIWSEEDGAFVAVCPEFEGISAFGRSGPEAVHELNEALQLAVEAHRDEGWPIPQPLQELRFSGQFRLRLPRSLHGWLSERAHLEGVSLNTLAVELLARARLKLLEESVGMEFGSLVSPDDPMLDELRKTLLAKVTEARQAPPPQATEHWAIAEGYEGIQRAPVVVVNVRLQDPPHRTLPEKVYVYSLS